jgi:hypothetical protein
MGTRSLTHVKSDGLESDTLVTVYRQYDGYISGMGEDIKSILNNGNCKLLNGFMTHSNPAYFNGMGCLAAYLISKLKVEIGNVYIYPPNSIECSEEYTYTVYAVGENVHIKAIDWEGLTIYQGALKDFITKETQE